MSFSSSSSSSRSSSSSFDKVSKDGHMGTNQDMELDGSGSAFVPKAKLGKKTGMDVEDNGELEELSKDELIEQVKSMKKYHAIAFQLNYELHKAEIVNIRLQDLLRGLVPESKEDTFRLQSRLRKITHVAQDRVEASMQGSNIIEQKRKKRLFSNEELDEMLNKKRRLMDSDYPNDNTSSLKYVAFRHEGLNVNPQDSEDIVQETPCEIWSRFQLPKCVRKLCLGNDGGYMFCATKTEVSGYVFDKIVEFPVFSLDCSTLGAITSMIISTDGNTLLVAGQSNEILVFDITDRAEPVSKGLFKCDDNMEVLDMCLTEDGEKLFVSLSSSTLTTPSISIIDTAQGVVSERLYGHKSPVTRLKLSHDESKLISVGIDSKMWIWDVESGQTIVGYQFASAILNVTLKRDTSWVAVALSNGRVECVDLNQQTPKKYSLINHTDAVYECCYADESGVLFSAGKDGVINCWKAPFGSIMWQTMEQGPVISMQLSRDEKFLVTTNGKKLVTVYSLKA